MRRPMRKHLDPKSLRMIGIPKKFIHADIKDFCTFDDKGLASVKEYIEAYLKDIKYTEPSVGIYMYGSNGVGKTMLACIIAKEAYRYRWNVRRVTFIDYINQYTRMWGIKNTEDKDLAEEQFYNTYKGTEMLILEEIGKEIDSSITAPLLEDLLRYREDNSLITIICTNIPMSVFKTKYGASCYSLIQGNMVSLKISSVDRREQALKGEI